MKELATKTKDWLSLRAGQTWDRAKKTVALGLGRVGQALRLAAFPVRVLEAKVPGVKYVVESLGFMFAVTLVILPPLSFVSGLSFGVGYAAYAALVSIPTYFWLLATSLAPWASLLTSSLILAGIWAIADWMHLHYGEADGNVSELQRASESEPWPAPPKAVMELA